MLNSAHRSVVCRQSHFGWFAIAASEQGVKACTLGHKTQRDALEALGLKTASKKDVPEFLTDAADLLVSYFEGTPVDFASVPLDLGPTTTFCSKVRAALQHVGYGRTLSYGELAKLVGSPGAARAVGSVMARNPVPIILPCHRVLGAANALGGYSAAGGTATKQRLLDMERRTVLEYSPA